MNSMKAGGGPVTSGVTSTEIAARCGGRWVESLTVYVTGSTVQITWASGEVSQISSAMNGHTFVAMNGSNPTPLDSFTIDTDCEIGFTVLGYDV